MFDLGIFMFKIKRGMCSVCKSQRFLGSWNQISGRAPYISIQYEANFQIDWPKLTRKGCIGEIKLR